MRTKAGFQCNALANFDLPVTDDWGAGVYVTAQVLRPMDVADLPILQRYRESMEQEVGAVGFPPTFTRAMLAHRIDDVVAIVFCPDQAFDQSPGPRAGTLLLKPEMKA